MDGQVLDRAEARIIGAEKLKRIMPRNFQFESSLALSRGIRQIAEWYLYACKGKLYVDALTNECFVEKYFCKITHRTERKS